MEASLRNERRMRFAPIAGALVLVLAGAAAGLAVLWHGRPGATTPTTVPVATARVVRTDVQQSQRLNATLGYGPSTTVAAPSVAGSITSLPAPGATVSQGQALYGVNDSPVVLMYGAQPAWRQLTSGVNGSDVKQLEQALISLGFADSSNLAVDGNFTAADAAAVRRWQASLGQPQTGSVLLGQVVFLPGPIRVTAVRATLGAQTQAGGPLLDVTSTQHVVTAQVPAQQQGRVHQGDTVSVLMPDGTTTSGSVIDVSRVATVDQSSQQGSGSGQQQGPPPAATVTATVRLASEAAAGSLDQAPVYVSITTAQRQGVLAVPVTALQAQPDGSYAVAVRSGGRRRLVTVEPGLFDARGLVEVSSRGLSVGDQVEVPAQ